MFEEIWQEITRCVADPGACLARAQPYWGYAVAALALLAAWLLVRRARRAEKRRTERRFLDLQRQQNHQHEIARTEENPEQRRELHGALVAIHIEIDLLINRLSRAAQGLREIEKAPPEKLMERFRGLAPEWLIDTRTAYLAGIATIAPTEAQVPATVGAFYDLVGIWNSRLRAFAAGVHGINGDMLKRLGETNQRIRAVGESARILIERYLEDEELPPLPTWVDVRFTDEQHNRIRKRSDGLDLGAK